MPERKKFEPKPFAATPSNKTYQNVLDGPPPQPAAAMSRVVEPDVSRYEPITFTNPYGAAQDGMAEAFAPLPGFICSRCSALVAHSARHAVWHWAEERQ